VALRLGRGNANGLQRWSGVSGLAVSDLFQPLLALLSLAIGIYVFATTTAMVIHSWSAIPYWDQWDNLIFSSAEVFSSWLYEQHNEHRILFPRLIFAIDTFAFAATNKFDLFCNLTIILGLAALIITLAHRHTSRRVSDAMWLTGIVLALLFSAMQYENFGWGFQVQFLGVELAATGSFAFLVLCQEGWVSLAAAIVCEAIALYTFSGGVLALLLSIPLAFWARRPSREIAVLAIAAAALLASYLYGYVTPPQHSDPLRTLLEPGVALFVMTEIGNPPSQLLGGILRPYRHHTAVAFGACGILLSMAAGLNLLRRGRKVARIQLVFLSIAVFGVGFALLTALGRLKFGPEQALSSRYTSPMLLLWSSLAMLVVTAVWSRHPSLRLVVMAVGLLCLFGVAREQRAFAKTWWDWSLQRREATTALLAEVDDPIALGHVYPDPQRVIEPAVRMKVQHLSIFADEWSTWLDTPVTDHLRLGEAARCRGGIDEVVPLAGAPRLQWRISGWAWDNVRDSAAERIVLVNAAGRVVGYGLSGFAPKSRVAPRGEWHGHFSAERAGAVTAYALVDQQREACALAAWFAPP
jgi:hypothetical protein